ncbi:hypothetical protein BC936DRAFT_138142 [Jimgerdemannia flammicorona]|uniref:Uncharacterized protein n=2 Tax=Jimgerdemannia flammicorona TaxID=994334 RepID=A0A433CVN0_9FUNG|nr:hypothetical protein BC936DRAFT_138142 [Jimgerdemannia flammicorona]RUS26030.1 hypothetical protein BC938DRAFT_471312 [Jimgerdemannia flammicorona]
MTKASTSLLLISSVRYFASRIEKTRSTPMETPTQGMRKLASPFLFFPENMPTNSSYRPPAAIDPTPTVDSSSSSVSFLVVGRLPSASSEGVGWRREKEMVGM